MNSSIALWKWQQFIGALNAQWGHVTGDRLRVIRGRHLQLVGGLHVACGAAKDEVRRQIDGVHRRSRALRARSGF